MKNNIFFLHALAISSSLAYASCHAMDQPPKKLGISTLISQVGQEQLPTLTDYLNFYEKIDAFSKARTPKDVAENLTEAKKALASIQQLSPNNVVIRGFIHENLPGQRTVALKKAVNAVYFENNPKDLPMAISLFMDKVQKGDKESQDNAILILQTQQQQKEKLSLANQTSIQQAIDVIKNPNATSDQIEEKTQAIKKIFQPEPKPVTEIATKEPAQPLYSQKEKSDEQEIKEETHEQKEPEALQTIETGSEIKKIQETPEQQEVIEELVKTPESETVMQEKTSEEISTPKKEIEPQPDIPLQSIVMQSTPIKQVEEWKQSRLILKIRIAELADMIKNYTNEKCTIADVIDALNKAKNLYSVGTEDDKKTIANLNEKVETIAIQATKVKSKISILKDYIDLYFMNAVNLKDVINTIVDIAELITYADHDDKQIITQLCQTTKFKKIIPKIEEWLTASRELPTDNSQHLIAEGFTLNCTMINEKVPQFPIIGQPKETWTPAENFPVIQQVTPSQTLTIGPPPLSSKTSTAPSPSKQIITKPSPQQSTATQILTVAPQKSTQQKPIDDHPPISWWQKAWNWFWSLLFG